MNMIMTPRFLLQYMKARDYKMPNKPKIKYGLKNVYYAKMTETVVNGVTIVFYDPPKAWPGAVNLSLPASGESSPFYADDGEYAILTSNQGYEGDFESAMIPDDVDVDLLGRDEVNGAIVESAENKASYFALMFEIANDVRARRHVLYRCCLSNRPTIESQTKTDSTEPKTDTITIKASPRRDAVIINGEEKHLVKSTTTENMPSSIYNNWFNSVWTPGIVVPAVGLDQDTLSLAPEATATLTATYSPSEATVNWMSTDNSVATVANGVVTVVAAGTATIMAIVTYEGLTVTASCAVTVAEG